MKNKRAVLQLFKPFKTDSNKFGGENWRIVVQLWVVRGKGLFSEHGNEVISDVGLFRGKRRIRAVCTLNISTMPLNTSDLKIITIGSYSQKVSMTVSPI